MRSLLKSPFPRLIVFKKKRKHSLSLSLSASTFFADPLISEKRSWREKGRGKKKKKQGEKASHVLSGRIRGRVQQPFLGE